MRDLFGLLITLIFVLLFTMLMNVAKKCNQLESELQAVQKTFVYENEKLRKEIRLLRTDMDVVFYQENKNE